MIRGTLVVMLVRVLVATSIVAGCGGEEVGEAEAKSLAHPAEQNRALALRRAGSNP
jgi:hypothetical protein